MTAGIEQAIQAESFLTDEHRMANGDLVVSREDRLAQQRCTLLPLQPDRIGVWRSEMSAADQALCLAAGAGLLESD